MAEEDNSQDKTEEPSQRKLDKAAEDGQVLSSKEMSLVDLYIYPNPSSEKVFVEFLAKQNNVINCIVYNQLGGVVKHIQKNCIVGNKCEISIW